MKSKIAEFRQTAQQRRKQGRSARYTGAERRFALEHAHQRMLAGVSVQRVAAELGLAGQTLTNWLRTEGVREQLPSRAMPQLVQVVTVSEPVEEAANRGVIVVVTGAVRVEVSDVAVAVELARSLR